GDGHGVGVLAGRLEPLTAGDGADQDGGVEQRVPRLLDGRGQDVLAGELHRVSSAVASAGTSACSRRRAKSSDGEIGIALMGKPSASSMAAANTAADGITPASPAPLMPSGLSGDGVSRWSISMDVGTSVT